MIQLTKAGLTGTANLKEWVDLFEQSHAFRIPQLLHSELIQIVSSKLQDCIWITHDDGEIAKDSVPHDQAPANILNFAANTPEFLGVIRRITKQPKIKLFSGRIYRMTSAANHFDSWHADLGSSEDRLVGMSINLSPRPYEGGSFRLRDESSGKILSEFSNTGPGDAIFFRISRALKHMVSPVSGTEAKTAFAGWFRSGDNNFYSMLRDSNPKP